MLCPCARSSVDEVIELLSGLSAEGGSKEEAFQQHDGSRDPALSDTWRHSLHDGARLCARLSRVISANTFYLLLPPETAVLAAVEERWARDGVFCCTASLVVMSRE